MKMLNSCFLLYYWTTIHLFILQAALATAEGVTNSTLNGTNMFVGSVPVVTSRIDHVIVKEGYSALIDCNIQGHPGPEYKWYNSNGHVVKDDGDRGIVLRFFVHDM